MTQLLYYPDNEYQKEFDAEVTKVNEEDHYIVLDQTLFYSEGGGQPADRGEISWNEEVSEVVDVQKENGEVRHYLEGDLPEEGQEIHGQIDWDRRYKLMRMHTAEHVISWIVLNMYGAAAVGNQLHTGYGRTDFEPADFSEKDIEKIEKGANKLIQKNLKVEKKEMPRKEAEEKTQEGRTNFDIIPDNIDPLRVITIGGEDICPCGGTHVDNLEEIGEIKIVDRKSKGEDKERLRFELE